MSGINVSEIITLGASAVSVGGVDVGHTDENGVKMTVKSEMVQATVGKYGKSPVKHFINGQVVEVEFSLSQSNLTNLANVLPGATRVTGSGKTKLTFGLTAGTTVPGVALVLTPYLTDASQSTAFKVTANNAVPVGDWEISYDGKKEQVYKCKFRIQVDEAGGANGSYLFVYGDPTASADVSAPTVSAVAPTNGATGVATSTTVVWTCSESLDGNTVNTANVLLFKDPAGGPTGDQVAGTVVLSNAGASTTITFTPTAALDGTQKYIAVLNGVKDLAGNALGMYVTDFTTA